MVELESPLALDGEVDVDDVVGARDEADYPGDDEDHALDLLKVGDAVHDDAARDQACKKKFFFKKK